MTMLRSKRHCAGHFKPQANVPKEIQVFRNMAQHISETVEYITRQRIKDEMSDFGDRKKVDEQL